jgi:Phage capsid family
MTSFTTYMQEALDITKQAACIYRRGGPTVEASNSHSDFFTKNLNMVRAEERLALAVFRPASFVVLRSDSQPMVPPSIGSPASARYST